MSINSNISLKQIAEETGFSIATISRVINNKSNVNIETKKIITRKLLEYGYAIKNSPKQEDSKTIVVLIPDYTNPFYSSVLQGIHASAELQKYKIVQILAPPSKEHDLYYYVELISDINARGIISLTPFSDNLIINELNRLIPLVMCSNHTFDQNISSVSIDDIEAAYNATNFILKSGRKSILFVNSNHTHSYARLRSKGFLKACKEHSDKKINFEEIHLPNINYNLAYSHLLHLFNKNLENFDSVFASSDIFATAATQAIKANNLNIPEDISVVGFDDIDIANIISPTLTTVQQPRYDIGFQACEILLEKISNDKIKPKQIIFPTHLIIREST